MPKTLAIHIDEMTPAHVFGGAGSTTYAVPSAAAATVASPYAITFDPSKGDLIDLTKVDADTVTKGTQAWSLQGNSQLGAHPGHLILAPGSGADRAATGPFQLLGDRDGDGVADFAVDVTAVGSQATWVDVASHILF